VTKWDFHKNGDTSKVIIHAKLRDVYASGSALNPILTLQFENFESIGVHYSYLSTSKIIGIAASVKQDSCYIQTGFSPIHNQNQLEFQIDHKWIHLLTKEAENTQDRYVRLRIGLSMLAKIDGDLEMYSSHYSDGIDIDASKWLKFLKIWGYPETKLIPVKTILPKGLKSDNGLTKECWNTACEGLFESLDKIRINQTHEAGRCLRKAVQFAILTWQDLWFPNENTSDAWYQAALKIGKGITNEFKDDWKIPDKYTPDEKRLMVWLISLKDLNSMANPFHHVGKKPIYSREDVDFLVTVVTAALGALPSLWEEYPNPLTDEGNILE